jgi:hypothetical protein
MSAQNVIIKQGYFLVVGTALALLLASAPGLSQVGQHSDSNNPPVETAPLPSPAGTEEAVPSAGPPAEQSDRESENTGSPAKTAGEEQTATGSLAVPAVEEQAAAGDQSVPVEEQAATGGQAETAKEEQAAAEGQAEPAGEDQAAVEGQAGTAVEDQAGADGQPGPAEEGQAATSGITEMDVVSIINTDDQGDPFLAPYYVFCDRAMDESYVVSDGRITVYGDNFFPVASIGTGRGLITAAGVSVDREGNVYVPQGRYYDQAARITVYNAAFFPVKQIELSTIPDVAEAGTPRSLVIHDNGFIYVAFGEGVRGLLVLDKDGGFSHWLKPMDLIYDQQAIVEPSEAKEQEEEAAESMKEPAAESMKEPDFDVSELVQELVPRKAAGGSEQARVEEEKAGMGPVQINDVQQDENGNLYLLSTETCKVYLYSAEEEFLYSFGEKGSSTGQLSQPRQVVVDDKKKAIYIVDYMRHAILIYDMSGRFMHEFGGKGNRPGWFQYPNSIAINSKGELLVSDMFNRRVQVLDVQFEYTFPLFRVPFVFRQEELPLPQPFRAAGSRPSKPGFPTGEQASAAGDREWVKALLEIKGGMI